MILTPAEYYHITPTDPFTWPPNPGILVPNPVRTAAQIASAENNHRFNKKIYLETLLLERTFIQQIIEAIDTKYIAALRNPITGEITPLVPTIIEFVHNNYGPINQQQLDDKTTTVKSLLVDRSIVVVYELNDGRDEWRNLSGDGVAKGGKVFGVDGLDYLLDEGSFEKKSL